MVVRLGAWHLGRINTESWAQVTFLSLLPEQFSLHVQLYLCAIDAQHRYVSAAGSLREFSIFKGMQKTVAVS
jgi:hypothetical protein